jgi:uncharacterized coiled-coil protein SlyX
MNTPLKQGSYTRTNGGQAEGIWPEFFLDTIEDPVASAREGRQCFKDEERVRLHFPGDQTKKPVFKVTQEYIERWPDAYKAFKEGVEPSVNGTPLEQWPVLRKAHVLELKALGFRTVEDVAAMSDLATQKVGMGGPRMKQLAQVFLDDSLAQALVNKVTAENEALTSRIGELENKLENQTQLLERVSSQLIALQNTPSPIATHIPGMHDPVAAAQQAMGGAQMAQQPAQSSLANLPAPRQRRQRQAQPQDTGEMLGGEAAS